MTKHLPKTTQAKQNNQWVTQFTEAMKDFYSKASVYCFSNDARHYVDYLGDHQLVTDATQQTLIDYLEHLGELTNEAGELMYKQATLNRNRASLVAFYNYLTQQGVMIENPATNIRSVTIYKKGREEVIEHLSEEEARALLTCVKEGNQANYYSKVRDLVFIHLMLSTGITVSELAELTLDHVDLEQQTLTITNRERDVRVVQFPTAMKEEIEVYLKERQRLDISSDLFVVSNRGTRISTQNGNALIAKYVKKLNLGRNISNVALRHTFAIQLIRLGVPIEEVSRLLGNRSTQYTKRVYEPFLVQKQPNYSDYFNY